MSLRTSGFSGSRFSGLFVPAVIFLTVFPTTTFRPTAAANTCPRKCQCIWRDSKITVDCSNQTLASIPTTVERNTQVLNVSGNDIPIFGRAHFSRLGLINLQRVSCARCNLVSVDPKAFLGLTNLVELDLSNNKLSEVRFVKLWLNCKDGSLTGWFC